jgi:hypothetical protein
MPKDPPQAGADTFVHCAKNSPFRCNCEPIWVESERDRDGTAVALSPFMDLNILAAPQNHTFAGIAAEDASHDGFSLNSVELGTTLIVQTLHSEYRLIVLNGTRRSVLVHGGNLLPHDTLAVLQGSTDSGNALKPGWIGIGLRMELSIAGRRLITSPVRSVTVEP